MHFNIYHVLTISVVVSAFPSLKSRSSHQTHICADIPGLMEADVIDSLDYSFTLVANLKDAPNKKLSFGFSNVDLQEPARFGPSTVFTLKASRLVEAGSRIPIVQSELRIFPPTVALYPGFILPFKVLTDGSHTFIEINHDKYPFDLSTGGISENQPIYLLPTTKEIYAKRIILEVFRVEKSLGVTHQDNL